MPVEPTLDWPLRRAMQLAGDRVAVVDGDTRMTYRELAARTRAVGGGLGELGLRPGDVVSALALNSYRHLELWLGVPTANLVLNDLNIRLAVDELAFIVDDAGSRALVTDGVHLETSRELQRRCPAVETLIWADHGDAPDGIPHWDDICASSSADTDPSSGDASHGVITADTLASICYTGGTTGRPKGVMQTHGNLIANARHVLLQNPLSIDDRFLHCTPMFHAAGVANIYGHTWVAGTHVVAPRFEPDLFVRLLEAERATVSVLVPTMVNMLLQHPGTAERDLSSWRLLIYGASPMPIEVLKRAMATLPCDFVQVYGMTEASPHVAGSTAADHRRALSGRAEDEVRLMSCGTPALGVDVEIRAPDGRVCDVGEVGEIVLRGPNVMPGYWKRPQETADAFTADGFYRSGDLASRDSDGYLYVVDRIKDMIITGAENVYTSEVENALYAVDDVVEVAVFGVPHAQWGEAVHAEVVVRAGATITANDLADACRSQIAGFKVPRSFNIRTDPLPKSGAGKILKRDLRQPFWDGRDRAIN